MSDDQSVEAVQAFSLSNYNEVQVGILSVPDQVGSRARTYKLTDMLDCIDSRSTMYCHYEHSSTLKIVPQADHPIASWIGQSIRATARTADVSTRTPSPSSLDQRWQGVSQTPQDKALRDLPCQRLSRSMKSGHSSTRSKRTLPAPSPPRRQCLGDVWTLDGASTLKPNWCRPWRVGDRSGETAALTSWMIAAAHGYIACSVTSDGQQGVP